MASRGPNGKIRLNFQITDQDEGAGSKGRGRNGQRLKRHKSRGEQPALCRPALRRLARRAGVKRINEGIYEEIPTAMRAWMGGIIRDAATFTEHARRMTVTVNDILYALKRNGV